MARQLTAEEASLAPSSFIPIEDKDNEILSYHCELITPMAGGGTKSWQPDLNNPVRSQSVKGQLRFWWRTMQSFTKAKELKKAEDEIWGSTKTAGTVRLQVQRDEKITNADLLSIEKNDKGILQFSECHLPGYVLFSLQGQKNLVSYQLIRRLHFQLEIMCADFATREEVQNTVKLWLLFGGLGSRTRRGCGSIYCREVMGEFQTGEDIQNFIKKIYLGKAPAPYTSHYPVLGNCRFAFNISSNQSDPAREWCSYLTSYGNFRQGRGVGRNQGQGNRPGRTRWPEADAIRRITKKASANHTPEHPAGNWFPRGVYGMPILTEFKNAQGDPINCKFFLQPDGSERWPSPVFLKVIKLKDRTIARVCLILNHAVPDNLALWQDGRKIHDVSIQESPLSSEGKIMPENAHMLHSNENPYDALIRHLNLTEVK